MPLLEPVLKKPLIGQINSSGNRDNVHFKNGLLVITRGPDFAD